jgi:galactokinase
MEFTDHVRDLIRNDGFFSASSPVYIARSPGRLDLMGGNDDYTGGLVFESTIREATYAAAQLRNDQLILLKNKTASEAGWQGDVTVSFAELHDDDSVRKYVNNSPAVRWTAYVLGTLYYLKKKFSDRIGTGIQLFMDSTVPLNRGVSSSAAIEVSVMKAAASAYGIDISGIELALACQWVENVIAGSACGIMDQITVVAGKEGFILPLVCQPCIPESLIRLPDELQIWGIDSGVSHQISGIEYEAARASAFIGYKMICDHEGLEVSIDKGSEIERYTDPLWNGYLANLSPSLFHEKYEEKLPVTIISEEFIERHAFHVDPFTPLKEGVVYAVRANTLYAVEENYRVQLFSELSKSASLVPSERAYRLMGELMYQSHYSYTECGLGSEATDLIVNLFRKEGINNGIYGAKITGGGAGGTVAILTGKNGSEIVHKVFDLYEQSGMGDPYLFEGSSDGADTFGILKING